MRLAGVPIGLSVREKVGRLGQGPAFRFGPTICLFRRFCGWRRDHLQVLHQVSRAGSPAGAW